MSKSLQIILGSLLLFKKSWEKSANHHLFIIFLWWYQKKFSNTAMRLICGINITLFRRWYLLWFATKISLLCSNSPTFSAQLLSILPCLNMQYTQKCYRRSYHLCSAIKLNLSNLHAGDVSTMILMSHIRRLFRFLTDCGGPIHHNQTEVTLKVVFCFIYMSLSYLL